VKAEEIEAIARKVADRAAALEKAGELAGVREAELAGFLEAALDAQKLLQVTAEAVQRVAHARITELVSHCLTAVFGEAAYEFKIEFEQKRGKTEARVVFLRDGHEVDPVTAAGGGTVDVAAFALRLAAVLFSKPPVRRLLVLDEPFRMVSEEYQPRVREMVEGISERLGVQVIMVTHNENLVCGNVERIE
jgi:DNA repair exonuclease SbcCD ATPase subunit